MVPAAPLPCCGTIESWLAKHVTTPCAGEVVVVELGKVDAGPGAAVVGVVEVDDEERDVVVVVDLAAELTPGLPPDEHPASPTATARAAPTGRAERAHRKGTPALVGGTEVGADGELPITIRSPRV
jgi:hypothetical protein